MNFLRFFLKENLEVEFFSISGSSFHVSAFNVLKMELKFEYTRLITKA